MGKNGQKQSERAVFIFWRKTVKKSSTIFKMPLNQGFRAFNKFKKAWNSGQKIKMINEQRLTNCQFSSLIEKAFKIKGLKATV